MNRNLEDEQQKEQQTTSNNPPSPLIEIPQRDNQPRKSAFRPWNQLSMPEEDPREFDLEPRKERSSTSADTVSHPLENYFYKNLKAFMMPRIELSKIVYSECNMPSAVMVDLSSSDSQKSHSFKKHKNEELSPDLKKILKDRSTLPLKDRKCCKCKKSHCLLLYCDCFRAGQICEGCNCQSCMNTLEHSKERIEAIKRCLDTNPLAFVTEEEGKVSKGCKCRKSGCKKGYCQCFQQGKDCSSACICINCQNHSEHEKGPQSKGAGCHKVNIEALAG